MSKNHKQSSASVASLAAKTLNNDNASAISKSFAGSVLSQSNTGNQTGANLESKASDALNSSKYSDLTKTLAASVLSQSNKDR